MSGWVRRDCSCGGSMRAKSTPAAVALELVTLFEEAHSGDGCAPATAKQASRARAKIETVGADT